MEWKPCVVFLFVSCFFRELESTSSLPCYFFPLLNCLGGVDSAIVNALDKIKVAYLSGEGFA